MIGYRRSLRSTRECVEFGLNRLVYACQHGRRDNRLSITDRGVEISLNQATFCKAYHAMLRNQQVRGSSPRAGSNHINQFGFVGRACQQSAAHTADLKERHAVDVHRISQPSNETLRAKQGAFLGVCPAREEYLTPHVSYLQQEREHG